MIKDLKLRKVLEGGIYASMIAIEGMDVSVLWKTRSNLSAWQTVDLVYLDRTGSGVHLLS